MAAWAVLILLVALVAALAVRASRPGPDDDRTHLQGNDLAPRDPVTGPDARGAVNRHSWMLGGGGSGG